MDPLAAGGIFVLAHYLAEGPEAALRFIGEEAASVLERARRLLADLIGAEVVDRLAHDPQGELPRAEAHLEAIERDRPADVQRLIALVQEYEAALSGRSNVPVTLTPAGARSANVGSVLGHGSVSAGRDIVGRDKRGS